MCYTIMKYFLLLKKHNLKYIFRLEDSNHNLLEESPESYIGEYEKPSLSYKFREIFEHNKKTLK